MASSKKPNHKHKVELKLVNEKKRRKSDLVIMWQSIWGLLLHLTLYTRHTLHELWESLKLWLWHDEYVEVRSFLKKHLPKVPDDLTHSWRDGKLLCILLNKLHPGCIPGAEVLNPNYALRNMYHAFDILENTFGIKPSASAEELIICIEGSNVKLLEILSQLKKKFEINRNIPKIIEPNETQEEEHNNNSESKNCVAKGTGLMLAFVGRAANFVIFCSSVTKLNLVLEIKGPLNTICRERITKRSPKKKQSTTQLPRNNPHCLSRSNSYNESISSKYNKDEVSELEKNLIPLEYDIYMNQISVSYTPLIEGQHVISILWHGEHVSDSPYVVQVEPTVEMNSIHKSKGAKLTLKSLEEEENSECKESTKKCPAPLDKIERIGKVIKRRILRHIVKIKDKDIVVDSSDINHLAVALLKMDYNFQTDPSKSRRNSWGFAGDAERKLSVIRQFCVPPDEMEAQQMNLQRRTRSLTINANVLPPLRRNTSFETEDIQQLPRLETVAETMLNSDASNFHFCREEDEEVFADLVEEFQVEKQTLKGTESEIGNYGLENCNSEEIEDNHGEYIDRFSTKSTEVTDETLQSLLNMESKDFLSNDLNAENSESLSPDSLTMSQEVLVRQIEETKLASNESNEFINDKYDNFSKTLNLNLESCKPLDGENVKSEFSDDACSENENYVATSESNVLNKEAQNHTMPNVTKNLEDSSIHSTCFIEKYPNLMKYLDELCTHSSSGMVESGKKDSETKPRFYCQREKDTHKIRYPTMIRSSCKRNCFHNHQENEGKRRYKFYRKNRKYRSKTCNKETNQIYHNVPQNNNTSIQCPKQTFNSHSERKNMEKYVEHKAWNKIEQLSPKVYDNERNVSAAEMTQFNVSELSDKTSFSKCTDFTNNRKKSVLNVNPVDANSLKGKEKNDSSSLTDNLNKTINSSKEFVANYFSDEPVISGHNSFKESMSQDLFQLTSPQLEPKINNFYIQEHNLVSLGQFNFKQFNLSNERNKGNLIKSRIKKLESAIVQDSQKANCKSRSERSNSIELVDVKSKLTFWENACKSKRRTQSDLQEAKTYTNQSSYEGELKNQNLNLEEMGTTDFKTKIRSDEFLLNAVDQHNGEFPLLDVKVIDRCADSTGANDNVDYAMPTKQTSELNQDPKSKRSFSDPVMMDFESREGLYASQNKLTELIAPNNVSSTDNLSSSLDADYWETSIDDEDSGAEVIVSTEDEYIDDEIPNSTVSTYWGDLNHMKNSKMANMSSYEEYCQYIDSEILKNQYHCAEDCPSECKVFGIGNYFGYVAVKNRFHVLTKGAGSGNLSVSVQGFGKHDVSFVSVRYKQKDIYEVVYQVMRPGLYLISLRWMENPIVGSPFLCKITF